MGADGPHEPGPDKPRQAGAAMRDPLRNTEVPFTRPLLDVAKPAKPDTPPAGSPDDDRRSAVGLRASGLVRTAIRRGQGFLSSLAGRLTMWFFGASFLIVVISTAMLYWATVHALQWADDQVLEKRMLAMRALLQETEPTNALITDKASEDNQGPRQIFIRVESVSPALTGETPGMTDTLVPAYFPDVSQEPFDERVRLTIARPDGLIFRALTVRVPIGARAGPKEAVIQVATDTTLDAEGLAWFRRLLAGVLAGAFLLCSIVGWHIVRQELAPLRRIAEATSRTSFVTLGHRLDLDGLPDELHHLASEFNDMLTRLETTYSRLRQYADNVAHELRGPVSKMLLGLEVTLKRDSATTDYRAELEANFEECQGLARIVDSLLFLARAENTDMRLHTQPVDIQKELILTADFFDATAEEAGVTLTVKCRGALSADAERMLFQRAISNLVSNAIAHTPRGGSVTITARREPPGMIAIEVADTGEGIPLEAQAHIFDRFYRADQVRSATSGRMGLGLPITRSIVMLHGGIITLDSAPGNGTRMKLTFRETNT